MFRKAEGIWLQLAGEAKERWGKLTDDDIIECEGRREVLAGKLQELYGMSLDEAGEQIAEMEKRIEAAQEGAERYSGA